MDVVAHAENDVGGDRLRDLERGGDFLDCHDWMDISETTVGFCRDCRDLPHLRGRGGDPTVFEFDQALNPRKGKLELFRRGAEAQGEIQTGNVFGFPPPPCWREMGLEMTAGPETVPKL